MKLRRSQNQKPEKSETRRIFDKEDKAKKAQQKPMQEEASSASEKSSGSNGGKIEEIYSTKDKLVKYRRLTPIEAEQDDKRKKLAKEKLASGKAEISLKSPEDNTDMVELTTEFEEGTVIAEDIIDEVEEFTTPRNIHIEDIDEIDIDIDPSSAIKKYERQVNSKERYDERHQTKTDGSFERIFGKPRFDVNSRRLVEKIPTYQHESKVNMIHLKAGRFTDVVEQEYDEYLKSNDPTISKRYARIEEKIDQKQSLLFTLSQMAQHRQHQTENKKQKTTKENEESVSEDVKKKHPSKIKRFFKISKSLLMSKEDVKGNKDKNDFDRAAYQGRLDTKQALSDITSNFKKLMLKTAVLSLCCIVLIAFAILEKSMGKAVLPTPYASIIYCSVNLLLLIVSGITSKQFIINGLKPLKGLKGNSDTAVAVAFIVSLIQGIIAMFVPSSFVGASLHLYAPIVALGLLLNTIGRLIMVSRVRSNFKFITSKSAAFAAKIFKDEDTARRMLSGTAASHSVVAYQHPTDYLSDFLKISYAPDPSEEIAGKLAPITVITSVFVCIAYAVVFKTFIGAVSALCVMCCIGIPVCALLAGNIPLRLFCKKTLAQGAMVSGYPSVRQFCDSNAVMLTASDLYPKSSIKLDKIINYAEFGVEESLLYAAAVLKEADSPLYSLFEETFENSPNGVCEVESVMYEDKLGLVGWIAGERVLIGNKKLLDRYHISIRDAADELKYTSRGKQVTYIACSGRLVSMVVSEYKPDPRMKYWLHKAEENGLCVIVSTTDSNVTAEKLAQDYQIFYRTVKVLSTGYANTCIEVQTQREETSRAYLATRGKASSLLCAISGCVRLKSNLLIGMVVQIFAIVLGVLLCATIALYATVSMLSVVELLLYMLFWGIATVVAELVVRP